MLNQLQCHETFSNKEASKVASAHISVRHWWKMQELTNGKKSINNCFILLTLIIFINHKTFNEFLLCTTSAAIKLGIHKSEPRHQRSCHTLRHSSSAPTTNVGFYRAVAAWKYQQSEMSRDHKQGSQKNRQSVLSKLFFSRSAPLLLPVIPEAGV